MCTTHNLLKSTILSNNVARNGNNIVTRQNPKCINRNNNSFFIAYLYTYCESRNY